MEKLSPFVLKALLTTLVGALFAFFLFFLLAKISFRFDNRLYQLLGIKKPQIIGFQPFWLLKRADKDYQNFINTFTYFSLTLDSDGTILKLVNPHEEEPGWTTLRTESFKKRLKQAKKDNLKFSLLVHSSRESTISALLKKPKQHGQNLVNNVLPLMEKYGFGDLNLDIESFKEASESAQKKLTAFVQEVKKGIKEKNLGTLTVEINPTALIKPRLTDVQTLGEIADYLLLMAYDFHYINSYLAGPVAPIRGKGKVREYDIETALKEMLNFVSPEKIILGIPLYGYEWETIDNQPGAPTIPGGGSIASHRRTQDFLTTCEDCSKDYGLYSKQPYVIFADPDKQYFHQIFYEDQKSLKDKLALAKKYKISGVALWALGYEGEEILKPLKEYKQSFEW